MLQCLSLMRLASELFSTVSRIASQNKPCVELFDRSTASALSRLAFRFVRLTSERFKQAVDGGNPISQQLSADKRYVARFREFTPTLGSKTLRNQVPAERR